MTDRLSTIWRLQAEQQAQWYDLETLSAEDRSAIAMELLLNAHKQLVDLQRVTVDSYHLLKREHAPTPAAVVSPATGLAKILVSLLQLGGVNTEMFMAEFNRETTAVTAKWKWEQDALADTEVLLSDIDGVIGSWFAAFMLFLKGESTTTWELVESGRWSINAPQLEEYKDQFHEQGGFADIPVNKDALDSLNRWRRSAVNRRLILVTARPYRRHRRVYMDTMSWCASIGLAHDHILFEPDKAEAVRLVKPASIVAHIEDRGRHALEVAHTGVKVLKLPHESTNDEDVRHPNIITVKGWAEIDDHLGRLSAPRR